MHGIDVEAEIMAALAQEITAEIDQEILLSLRSLAKAKFKFCDDLDAPQLCVIMNQLWWSTVEEDVKEWFIDIGYNWKDQNMVDQHILYIPDPKVRTMFLLKWS